MSPHLHLVVFGRVDAAEETTKSHSRVVKRGRKKDAIIKRKKHEKWKL